MPKKRQLRDEWRKNHKAAPRREIGRTPNWVYRERKEAMGKFEELRDDTVLAFEESTGDLPSDVELGQIEMLAREYVEDAGSE